MSRLLELYPALWRERYGAEFVGLLESRPPSFGDRVDIVRGAIDARLDPQVGASDPGRATRGPVMTPGAIAAVLGGALWAAMGIGYAAAEVDPALGYKNTDWSFALGIGGALITALVAVIHARSIPDRPRGQTIPAALMVVGGFAMALPWPILALGFYMTMIGTMLFGAVIASRGGRIGYVLVAAAMAGLVFNTETAAALLLVPLGAAWILFGARLAWPRKAPADLEPIP
jgi:hypothetical protein